MPEDMEIPMTMKERLELDGPPALRWAPESKKWFDKEENEQLFTKLWASPSDPRFVQWKKQRMCYTYFVDFNRCTELLGADYEPCRWFKNVYQDICPNDWLEKWESQVEEGRFPARFDR